eukprot:m.124263 g.124263  ORF g.124263 m.124263 type:complete len:1129 (+) comp12951_c0_seq1:41-3427(+)
MGELEELLPVLEGAAKSITGEGDSSSRAIEAANEVFLQFRSTPQPYQIAFNILETTTSDYVKFETFETLKGAVVREWNSVDAEMMQQIRDQILTIVTTTRMANYARLRGITCAAVCYKLGWRENSVVSAFFDFLEQLLFSDDDDMLQTGIDLVVQTLSEFSTSRKSSAVGLTWETHVQLKKTFEGNLRNVFALCIKLLNAAVEDGTREKAFNVVHAFQALTHWHFYVAGERRLMGSFSGQRMDRFKPGPEWSDIINNELIHLLFKAVSVVGLDDNELCLSTLQSLQQLSSVSGGSFPSRQVEFEYFLAFVVSTNDCVQNLDADNLPESVCLFLCTIVKNILDAHSSQVLAALDDDVQQALLESMSTLLQYTLNALVTEDDDNPVFTDAFDAVLSAWLTIIRCPSDVSVDRDVLCLHVFNQYVESRMVKAARDGVSECEVRDEDIGDVQKYNEQLLGIAEIARCAVGGSIELITNMFGEKLPVYKNLLVDASAPQDTLCVLHEEIHWLLLITACILADPAGGEVPMIPTEINAFFDEADKQGGDNTAVALVGAVMQLCQFEDECFDNNAAFNLSPQVSASIMYFFQRVCSSYLMLDETLYRGTVCQSFINAFSGDNGSNMLTTFVEKISRNLTIWSSDKDVIDSTLQLLEVIVSGNHQRHLLCESGHLSTLASALLSEEMSTISDDATLRITRAVCRVSNALSTPKEREEALSYVLEQPLATVSGILENEDFISKAADNDTKQVVSRSFSSIRGAIQSTIEPTLQMIANNILPGMDQLEGLVRLYKHDILMRRVLLDVVLDVTNYWVSCAVRESKCEEELVYTYKCIYNTLKAWQEIVSSSEVAANDAHMDELLAVVNIIKSLSSIEYFDFLEPTEKPQREVEAADVVIEGVSFVAPLLTKDIIQIPQVATNYYSMLDIACEAFPEKVYMCSQEQFQQIVETLKVGMESSTNNVVRCSLGVMQSLASVHLKYVLGGVEGNWDFSSVVGGVLQFMFETFVFNEFDLDLLEGAATTFFLLICCDMAEFESVCQSLLGAQVELQLFLCFVFHCMCNKHNLLFFFIAGERRGAGNSFLCTWRSCFSQQHRNNKHKEEQGALLCKLLIIPNACARLSIEEINCCIHTVWRVWSL